MEEQAKYHVKNEIRGLKPRVPERPFHNEYYQGKRRKQYSDSGKLFLFAVAGLAVMFIIMIFTC